MHCVLWTDLSAISHTSILTAFKNRLTSLVAITTHSFPISAAVHIAKTWHGLALGDPSSYPDWLEIAASIQIVSEDEGWRLLINEFWLGLVTSSRFGSEKQWLLVFDCFMAGRASPLRCASQLLGLRRYQLAMATDREIMVNLIIRTKDLGKG